MNDQYEGHGGSYVIDESGARRLVERTRGQGDPAPSDSAQPEQAAQAEPAPAGSFSPVAPAEQFPTTE
jgi:hypothetical protein